MSEQGHFSRRLREMAGDFERALGEGRAGQIAARAIARAQTSPRRRMLAVAAATTVSLVGSVVGIAVLADSSVPGDFLYDVDRAVEILGFDGNSVEERLEEVIVLADRGQAEPAILLAAEALAEIEKTGQVTPVSPSPTTTVAATPTPSPDGGAAPTVAPDPVMTLRLAAEYLLRTIRDPEAADNLADAAAGLAAAALALDEIEDESATTTTAPSTTLPAEEEPATTTTAPSTTVPAEDGSTTSTTEGSGTGPIIFPPAP